ncbi:methylated-DNA--[protein]-cysteine S-methyltransferase [Streptomyces sp. NBC_00233]|uniref:methylated-DNA--[protein]-cysteine S-methyltransferase n=1 Tax=Streptomyces sp. NBC_00233 TaxID=2975686 RepID=UPI0022589450|nr:methylated-DNA--[protein]-cysteine S-methyltransferase [Streptomyces sp. NBC_00233]MCX5233101.1 methylated-DNA--[protein]-cysteine S-methyltransferase [Streptomyces sp. NBC_00233]
MYYASVLQRLPRQCVLGTTASPVGPLTLMVSDHGVHALLFDRQARQCAEGLQPFAEDPSHPVLALAGAQIAEYFAAERQSFDLPVVADGTDFQKRVWKVMAAVPYGHTATYGDLGRQLGDTNLARAVGTEIGLNPVALILPCHRIVARNTMAGFAGGTEVKRFLIDFEQQPLWTSLELWNTPPSHNH